MDSIKRRNKLKFQIKDYCSCAEVCECDCWNCAEDNEHFPEFNTIGDSN